VHISPEAHPAYYTMGTECFSGAKRPERGADHPLHSSSEAADGFEVYLCLPSMPAQVCYGVIFTFTFHGSESQKFCGICSVIH